MSMQTGGASLVYELEKAFIPGMEPHSCVGVVLDDKQVTECIEMTRLSARTWSERMLKIVALSSKRAQIENILHGADDHEMCVVCDAYWALSSC